MFMKMSLWFQAWPEIDRRQQLDTGTLEALPTAATLNRSLQIGLKFLKCSYPAFTARQVGVIEYLAFQVSGNKL